MFPIYKFGRTAHSPAGWDAKYGQEGAPSLDPAAYFAQSFVQTLLRFLPPGAHVLDAGCGTGGLLRFLSDWSRLSLDQRFSVAGVDASAKAIEIAKRIVPDADLRVASIEQLPFPDASFDAYLAIGSWEYPLRGPERAAREAARVLRPGGLAFIEVPHANLLRRLFYMPLKRLEEIARVLRGQGPTFSHHLFRIREVYEVLRRAGFEILETHPHDLPEPTRHYGLWVDWPPLRGGPHYELNALGLFKKRALNTLSPWTIATGMFTVARKR